MNFDVFFFLKADTTIIKIEHFSRMILRNIYDRSVVFSTL